MPDIDPRVLACAGAARRATPHMIDCVAVATAVLDEWLKQAPTDGMVAEAQIDTVSEIPGSTITRAAYTAMCAEARREIAGG